MGTLISCLFIKIFTLKISGTSHDYAKKSTPDNKKSQQLCKYLRKNSALDIKTRKQTNKKSKKQTKKPHQNLDTILLKNTIFSSLVVRYIIILIFFSISMCNIKLPFLVFSKLWIHLLQLASLVGTCWYNRLGGTEYSVFHCDFACYLTWSTITYFYHRRDKHSFIPHHKDYLKKSWWWRLHPSMYMRDVWMWHSYIQIMILVRCHFDLTYCVQLWARGS